jgi:hypothetical protein
MKTKARHRMSIRNVKLKTFIGYAKIINQRYVTNSKFVKVFFY